MIFFKRQPIIVVHDGRFHADDIFACATLRIVLGCKGKIIRTRDEKIISSADYVVDVGGVNDVSKKRFDHHMTSGAGTHVNGIPYAAFGLVWKEYGAAISGGPEVAARVEAKLVCPIDADDNGMSLVQSTNEVSPYGLHNFLYTYRPTWKEDPEMYNTSFLELVPIAERIIRREIVIARDSYLAKEIVDRAYQNSSDKRLVELDGAYPYQETLTTYPEPLYVITPRFGSTDWKVETVRKNPNGFENRKPFPASWAGLRAEELAKVTGVPDAIFCHRGLFLATAKSHDGAKKLAELALKS